MGVTDCSRFTADITIMTTDAKNFLSDIKAAVMIGQPLESDASDAAVLRNGLTVQQIDRLLVNPDKRNDWSPRLQAALEFAQQTDSIGIVFEGLSVRLESQRWRNKVLRRTSWYLLLLVVVMVFGVAAFFYGANPHFANLRTDLKLMSAAQYVPQADPAAWMLPTILCGLVVALLTFIWIFLGGPQRTVWLFGGRSISQWRQTSVALRAIERTHQSGMSMERSIELACDLVAASTDTRTKIRSALLDARDSLGIVAWADSITSAARDRMTKIELWLPLVASALIGGALATFYCLLIYRPIISILCELVSAAEGV